MGCIRVETKTIKLSQLSIEVFQHFKANDKLLDDPHCSKSYRATIPELVKKLSIPEDKLIRALDFLIQNDLLEKEERASFILAKTPLGERKCEQGFHSKEIPEHLSEKRYRTAYEKQKMEDRENRLKHDALCAVCSEDAVDMDDLEKVDVEIIQFLATKKYITMEPIKQSYYSLSVTGTVDRFNIEIMPDEKLIPSRRQNTSTSNELISRLRKILSVSSKIRIDMLRNAMGLNKQTFDRLIFDWAYSFGFKIDGDYVIVDNADVNGFLGEIDRLFAEWDSCEKKV